MQNQMRKNKHGLLKEQYYDSDDSEYEETSKYTTNSSEEIRKIGLFDTQRIEFEDNKEPKKHGKYRGRRFK